MTADDEFIILVPAGFLFLRNATSYQHDNGHHGFLFVLMEYGNGHPVKKIYPFLMPNQSLTGT